MQKLNELPAVLTVSSVKKEVKIVKKDSRKGYEVIVDNRRQWFPFSQVTLKIQ